MAKTYETKLERMGLDLDDVKALYEEHVTLEKTAEVLRVSIPTLCKYLDQAGVKRKRGPKPTPVAAVGTSHWGCLAQWIKANPGSALPAGPADIATLTGCSEDAVKTYIYRKTRALKTALKSLPDLRVFPQVIWHDFLGNTVPGRAINSGSWTYNTRTFQVSYVAELKTGTMRKITKSLEDWRKVFAGLRRSP